VYLQGKIDKDYGICRSKTTFYDSVAPKAINNPPLRIGQFVKHQVAFARRRSPPSRFVLNAVDMVYRQVPRLTEKAGKSGLSSSTVSDYCHSLHGTTLE